ncbi:sterol desaturase family protein [Pedobacter arcticus]|uniref:sterol desaturase family protein n=1 Tax=Pedobacter arcticus TaxID=752140 RepID=UPI0002ECDFCD|nr:sterol desaturase family protein [Pedobacter arcticus]
MLFDNYKNLAIILLFVLVCILSITEMIYSYAKGKNLYDKKDTFMNIYLMGAAFLVNIASQGSSFFVLEFFYHLRFFEIKDIYIYYFVLFLAQDFLYWLLHAVGHYSRLFWAMHVTHHSSEKFNITTGFRSTVFEPLYRMFFYIPLPLMGFQVVDVLFMYLVTQIYGNIIHTQAINKMYAWFEYIFVTPSHHRVHHASNILYLDKNMGMVLIIWDRMFGTFQQELPEEKVVFGITEELGNLNFKDTIFHEFKNIRHDISLSPVFNDKLKYIFYPPGWSHDGRTQTAKVLQAQLKKK